MFIRVFAVLFGLAWGSFLNVVIHRVPRSESVVRPASRCPACGVPIGAFDNIPVLSFLLLRGKARCCGAKISPRYVLVEAMGGLMAAAIVETTLLTLPGKTPIIHVIAIFLANLALTLGLIAASFIDLEHMLIPDSISYGAAVLGLGTFALRPPLRFFDALLAGAGAFLVVWLVFGALYRVVRGRTGMGLGDAKLLMVAGFWFGWEGAVFVLLAGAVQGTIAAVAMLAVRGKIDEPAAVQREREEILASIAEIEDEAERQEAEKEAARDPIFEREAEGVGQTRIAFGPFLALATIEYLLFGRMLIESYFRWLVPS
ncbi:MAG: prepilin peptidase [Deltaproteobacteria bacterium]|nr:prepilin peptidase [Deltaproteobacteria bacterium]